MTGHHENDFREASEEGGHKGRRSHVLVPPILSSRDLHLFYVLFSHHRSFFFFFFFYETHITGVRT